MWDRLLRYCQETKRDGMPLCQHADTRDLLADIYIKTEVQRLFGLRNFWLTYAGKPRSYEGPQLSYYRKMTGLARVPSTDLTVFQKLQKGAGKFHVRYPHDGRHVEGDLTRQVLAEIEPGGRVRALYTMSSGKPSTPTVIGRFRVYSKTPGTNDHGMVDSNYFIGGYAIHGYAEALEEGALPVDEGIEVIQREAARLEAQVQDLLQLARMNRAEFTVR